ncbi:DUF2784 domain-containing protein [Dyella jejuensis]|uniref:DUF2784 domain-containing protein n=1 Tax=Dyella jejuensis TaxID=1432009 RepID=A0ABW8JLY9_9GAMM
MFALLVADAVLMFHLAFILFVALGGLLALKWRWIPWLQLPAVAWGAFVEISGHACPLTPMENHFRLAAGQATYQGDCIGHYLLAAIYPDGLTRSIQFVLAALVLLVNGSVYAWLVRRRARHKQRNRPPFG